MPVFFTILSVFILFTFISSTAHANTSVTYPHVQEISTKKGYSAWLIENHTLPIVTMRFTFKNAGFAYDPMEKQGLAYLTARMLNEGAGDMDALTFKKRLETLAIDFETDIDEDNFHISIRLLKENIISSLELLNLALTQPRFVQEDLERIRAETLVALAKKKEDPNEIAVQAWNKLVFGDHPYSNEETGIEKTLLTLSTEMLKSNLAHSVIRSNVFISVVGDITVKELASLLDAHLELPEHTAITPELSEYAGPDQARTQTIIHPNQQTIIIFGQRGLKYDHPDYYAAHVLNYILGGGGFQSRLMTEIREKRGLAYTVSTNLDPLAHAAVLQGYVATRNSEAKQALNLIKKEMTRLKNEGVTEEELKAAKDYLIGSYPLRMTSSSKLVNMMDFMQRNRLGSDFMERRNTLVEAVTLEDINRVAKTLLEPDRLVTVTVGQ